MCKKRNSTNGLIFNCLGKATKRIRLDSCMCKIIQSLSFHGYHTYGCCCGHGKHPMTIVCGNKDRKRMFDLISGVDIPRNTKFYKKDKQGYFFIPECEDGCIKDGMEEINL